jgi:Zn finger protein HypA/HybF involved in hydrogenase expression
MDNQAIKADMDVNQPKSGLPKYHVDGPFEDPLIRCNNCGTLHMTEKWKKKGYCSKCGNRRCRNVIHLTDEEFIICRNWPVDPDFMKLFEQVDDD